MTDYPWGELLASLPWAALGVVVALGVTFAVALRQDRHAVVDVTWGLGFAVVAAVTFVTSSGTGDDVRRWLLLAMTVVWGVRLGVHIGRRSRGKGEDPRYEAMFERSGGNKNLVALRKVYLLQGLLLFLISLPVQVGAFAPGPVGWLTWVGVAVWAVGLFFETVGDAQLQAFRDDPASKGKVLDTGLWRYTRHPNYFGDACVWWGIFLVSAQAWPGVLTVLSPLVMTYLLANGSGKPLLEKGMSDRRPGYDEYVARTSGFVPLPPKKSATTTTREI
jgi:steroid 5-alpha reductase family enzyme